MAIGWIKLHRQIQESDLWDSANQPFDVRSAWIDLLLLANHKDKKIIFGQKPMTVKAGQRVISIMQLSERWHWSRGKVTRYLDMLQNEGMLTRESDNKKTLITLTNYCKYQGDYEDDDTADESANGHQMSQQTDIKRTSNGQLIEQQTDTNKNDKNDKNEIRMKKNDKNEKKSEYGEYSHVRLTDLEHERLLNDLGAEMTTACIKYLDEYIEMKGYKAKNHYLCIHKWVINAVNERAEKQQPQTKAAQEAKAAFNMMDEWRKRHEQG